MPVDSSALASSTEKARSLLRWVQDSALGVVSTTSFPAIIGVADAMIKSSNVYLVGYEKTGGGQCSAIVRGGVADVRMAVHAGVETAKQFGQLVSSSLIPRPMADMEKVLPILPRMHELDGVGETHMSSGAIGLLETKGFPAMVGAADAMTKAAEIELISHETIGGGLCTILIRGSLSNVAIAVEAGMHEAERIGELSAVMVIPRPLNDLERSLPKVKQTKTEKPKKVQLPLKLEERQKELMPAQAPPVEVEKQKQKELDLPEFE
ncbi:BMC domain-containing protein [Leptothoe sp. PORK10 BA2]|uniref:BMC domain-containing protein n=1 Tax=Leptothoe sp. PORK10 BA2 TaxID=3110254 RepID=UPI002B38DF28|nr:carbon dioxide-concentrating mechanism protein CcmK [Leptothoe sp. PORK10 BA2]